MNIINEIRKIDMLLTRFNFAACLRALLLLSPVVLLFYTQNGLGVKELFLFQSVFYLVSIALEIPSGYLIDFIGKKYALLISYLFFISANILWLLFHGYFIILLGEILFAISKVLMDNTHSGYLYDYLKSENKQDKMPKQYGFLNFFLAFGTTVGAIIGPYLYSKFGFQANLYAEIAISVICILIVISLPNLYYSKDKILKVKEFIEVTKEIRNNKSIMYYIYYSGFLTSFSVVFALSFQPLLVKAASPIILFSVVAFLNHGIRALFSALTSRITKLISLRTMIKPLYFLYITAFFCIFMLLKFNQHYTVITMIFFICLIIGFQLVFTIRQVSRLHKFVDSDKRGTIISINNLFSRLTTFLVLLSSKLFMDKFGFEKYYLIIFAIFITVGLFLMIKTYKVEEKV